MIIGLKSDQPQATICLQKHSQKVALVQWQAHRMLAETIHLKLQEICSLQKVKLQDVTGFVVYEGPGSFTGLRIGLCTLNAFAYAFNKPIVGSTGSDWFESGVVRLVNIAEGFFGAVQPVYGSEVHITQQKK